MNEQTRVFLLIEEAERRQQWAEQQQTTLTSLLQATKNAGSALDKAVASLTPTVQQAIERAVPPVVARTMEGAAQTVARSLSQATAEPVHRLQRTVDQAEHAVSAIVRVSHEVKWQAMALLVLVGFSLGLLVSYFLAAKFILDDLAALRQQVQTLQQAMPATPPTETPRKPRR